MEKGSEIRGLASLAGNENDADIIGDQSQCWKMGDDCRNFILTNHIFGKQGTTATDFFMVKSPLIKPSKLPSQREIN